MVARDAPWDETERPGEILHGIREFFVKTDEDHFYRKAHKERREEDPCDLCGEWFSRGAGPAEAGVTDLAIRAVSLRRIRDRRVTKALRA